MKVEAICLLFPAALRQVRLQLVECCSSEVVLGCIGVGWILFHFVSGIAKFIVHLFEVTIPEKVCNLSVSLWVYLREPL